MGSRPLTTVTPYFVRPTFLLADASQAHERMCLPPLMRFPEPPVSTHVRFIKIQKSVPLHPSTSLVLEPVSSSTYSCSRSHCPRSNRSRFSSEERRGKDAG